MWMLIILEYACCLHDSVLEIPGNVKHIRRQWSFTTENAYGCSEWSENEAQKKCAVGCARPKMDVFGVVPTRRHCTFYKVYTTFKISQVHPELKRIWTYLFEYVHVLDIHLHSCLVHPKFGFFGAQKFLAPMAYKHFTPNIERARTFFWCTFRLWTCTDVLLLHIQSPKVGVTNTKHRRSWVEEGAAGNQKPSRRKNAAVDGMKSTIMIARIRVRPAVIPIRIRTATITDDLANVVTFMENEIPKTIGNPANERYFLASRRLL